MSLMLEAGNRGIGASQNDRLLYSLFLGVSKSRRRKDQNCAKRDSQNSVVEINAFLEQKS